ncbi:MAG: oxygenase MpaB family protein [Ilumatobacter sp.]|uniref:oxygenase MpaB family protein n=1 Tax=Ilumatobacter sp. TaxID=1967498 RepID=UPI002613BB6E|nr:oxygenase MpaB family protein [Ilumatobacter sp.]MDJ0767985.1 oxygenase MpaB family protein [Ilumatobacter sp.]
MPLDDVRSRIAAMVRAGVIGDRERAATRHAELFEAPGERWFEEESPIRRVHADSAMFVGGLRALLLQSLHPLAMAGVAEHSDYRHDPWGRLQRTADFLASTTYGPIDQAERAIARVHAVHERVTGVASDGRPYAANDPHLLRWVHLAEVDSFLAAHTRHGAEPLLDDERDEYVAQMAVIARGLGVPAPPESVRALRDQLRAYRPELRGTPEARDAARYLLLQPPMHPAARPVYGVIAAAAVAMLPRWARMPLRLPWMPVTERMAVRPAGDALTRWLRWALTEPAV